MALEMEWLCQSLVSSGAAAAAAVAVQYCTPAANAQPAAEEEVHQEVRTPHLRLQGKPAGLEQEFKYVED